MHAALRRHGRHRLAQIDPEFRIGLGEANCALPCDQAPEPEGSELGVVKSCSAFEIADADQDVVDQC